MPTPSWVLILGGGTAGSGPVKWSSKALLAGRATLPASRPASPRRCPTGARRPVAIRQQRTTLAKSSEDSSTSMTLDASGRSPGGPTPPRHHASAVSRQVVFRPAPPSAASSARVVQGGGSQADMATEVGLRAVARKLCEVFPGAPRRVRAAEDGQEPVDGRSTAGTRPGSPRSAVPTRTARAAAMVFIAIPRRAVIGKHRQHVRGQQRVDVAAAGPDLRGAGRAGRGHHRPRA